MIFTEVTSNDFQSIKYSVGRDFSICFIWIRRVLFLDCLFNGGVMNRDELAQKYISDMLQSGHRPIFMRCPKSAIING